MSRATVKPERALADISRTIAAEWYRVLPETASGKILPMDAHALTAAFNAILNEPCIAVIDREGGPLHIVVPAPPAKTRQGLRDYLKDNEDFWQGMGAAALFGCGR